MVPVGLSGAVDSALVLLEVDEGDGQLGEVGDVVVEQLGSLEHAGLEAAVSDLGDVGVVGRRDELFQIREPVETRQEKKSDFLLDPGIQGLIRTKRVADFSLRKSVVLHLHEVPELRTHC